MACFISHTEYIDGKQSSNRMKGKKPEHWIKNISRNWDLILQFSRNLFSPDSGLMVTWFMYCLIGFIEVMFVMTYR